MLREWLISPTRLKTMSVSLSLDSKDDVSPRSLPITSIFDLTGPH